MSETNETTSISKFNSEIENGRNKRNVECQFCQSKILIPNTAEFINIQCEIPLIKQKKTEKIATNNPEQETIEDFWLVKDMYTFENVGFSNTVDNKKFLTCANCEIGPIGFYNIGTKESFVALNRVNHVS